MQRINPDYDARSAAASNNPDLAAAPPAARAPRSVVWSAGLAVGGLVLGAIYLLIVRGDALMLDLSALSKYVLCF